MRSRTPNRSFWLADLSINQPVFMTMLALAVIVVGIVSYTRMAVDLYPDVSLPVVAIQTVYPGASPGEVEQSVSKPIEDAVISINGVDTVHSTSAVGYSIVTVEFQMDQDPKAAADEVRARLNAMRNSLPNDALEPVVETFDPSAAPVLSLAIADSSGQRSPEQLRSMVDADVKPALEQVAGVGSVDVSGGETREIHVDVQASRLRDYHLTPDRIVQAIRAANLSVPVGEIPNGSRDTLLTTASAVTSATQLADVPVTALPNGQIVRVRDVASVSAGVAQVTTISRLDGRTSVVAAVRKQSGSNTINVADAVKAKMADLQRQYPDLTVAVAMDQSTYTREAIQDLQRSLLIGALLAGLVVLAFFHDLRNTLVTIAGLPVVVLGTVAVLHVLGTTLNMISMMAMSLSIGMLIDDAIVVRENIYRHVEQGEEPRIAASLGTAEIAMAVVAVTSTIVAVFLPIALTGGIAGKFLRDFGLTVAVAVVISLVEAFTLAPMLSAAFFTSTGTSRSEGEGHVRRDSLMNRLTGAYRQLLGWSLRHRLVVVTLALFSLVASGAVFEQLHFSFVPASDLGEFTVSLDLGPGARLGDTDHAAQAVEHLLAADPSVQHVFTTVGTSNGTESTATIDVKLRERGHTAATIEQLRPRIQAAIPAIQFTVDAQSSTATMGSSAAASAVRGRPIQFSVIGDDAQAIDLVSAELERQLKNVPGVVDLDRSLKPGAPELAVVLDSTKADQDGVTPAQVGTALRAMVSGESAGTFNLGGQDVGIVVRLAEADRRGPSDLLQVPIVTARGDVVSLSDIGRLIQTTEPAQIDRENRLRQVIVGANYQGRDQGAVVADAQAIADRLALPPGVTIEASGQARYTNEMSTALGEALGLAVLFVYMILASQFGSFVQPLIIMLALPFSFVGALLALFLAHVDFDMLAMIGIILLMGLVTKNSILLVDLANHLCRQGMNARDAMLEAGPTRLRPILMTTVAMIGGMIPVALGLGAGAEIRRPMGMSVVGGLLTSTLLTLVVVPVVYSIVADARSWPSNLAGRLQGTHQDSVLGSAARGIGTVAIGLLLLAGMIWQAASAPKPAASPAATPTVARASTPATADFAAVGISSSPPSAAPPSQPAAVPSPARQAAPGAQTGVQVGNTDGLGVNLRPSPGTTQPAITALPEGTRLQPLGQTTSAGGHVWIKVRDASGAVGWVAQDYVVGAGQSRSAFADKRLAFTRTGDDRSGNRFSRGRTCISVWSSKRRRCSFTRVLEWS
jgi:HAE1 family hydrophobic/amphiphilic exporter-1